MADDIARVKFRQKFPKDRVGIMTKCYHNTDYLKAVLTCYSWVDKIILQNYRFPSVKETTDDTEQIAKSIGLPNIEFFKDDTNILQQHELTNRAINELSDLQLIFFVDADELMCRSDQYRIAEELLSSDINTAHVHIKDYAIDVNHQLPARGRDYSDNWCMVAFKPDSTRFTKLRQSTATKTKFFDDITMHHFGFVFPEDKLKWKIAWEADEEKIKEQQIWDAVNGRSECTPPPQEILDYVSS